MENELLKQYMELFDYPPIKFKFTDYSDKQFQELLKNAIDTKNPITPDDIEKAYENVKKDLYIESDFDSEEMEIE